MHHQMVCNKMLVNVAINTFLGKHVNIRIGLLSQIKCAETFINFPLIFMKFNDVQTFYAHIDFSLKRMIVLIIRKLAQLT